MRKGNLVRIKPSILKGYRTRSHCPIRLSASGLRPIEGGDENEWVLLGSWPMTDEERNEWKNRPDTPAFDSAGEPTVAPYSKPIPLTASSYLLEKARVCARDLSPGYYYSGMAVIRDLKTGQLCYVEREALEAINSSKRFRLRECVVKKHWVLEKAR